MQKVEFNEQLTMKLSKEQRAIVEKLAIQKDMSLGQAARFLLDAGVKVLGLGARSV
jgi:hypothetical protein